MPDGFCFLLFKPEGCLVAIQSHIGCVFQIGTPPPRPPPQGFHEIVSDARNAKLKRFVLRQQVGILLSPYGIKKHFGKGMPLHWLSCSQYLEQPPADQSSSPGVQVTGTLRSKMHVSLRATCQRQGCSPKHFWVPHRPGSSSARLLCPGAKKKAQYVKRLEGIFQAIDEWLGCLGPEKKTWECAWLDQV